MKSHLQESRRTISLVPHSIDEIRKPANYQLHLIALHYNEIEQGVDTPYLVVNGRQEWKASSICIGHSRDVSKRIYFSNNVSVELWECVMFNTDFVGSMTLNPNDIGNGICETNHIFYRPRGKVGNSSYILTYEVKPVP